MTDAHSFYSRLSAARGGDSPELTRCVHNVVAKLTSEDTDPRRPGMLLGKIQSGKTRGFFGVIAHAFDKGFDIAIVLTKGTKTLSSQTVARFKKDFAEFLEEDSVSLFDIMQMPPKLTRSERDRKLIFIAKKQVKNLERVLTLFGTTYPDLHNKRVLLIDDEADLASVRFVKNSETDEHDQGRIAQQMDDLRQLVNRLAFLQVTATPYALYLQPEDYGTGNSNYVFLPKRPAFTELLPIHSAYVGGQDYFGLFGDDDPRSYLFQEVSTEEQDTLRSIDGRSVRGDRPFTNTKIPLLRSSILTFITAVIVRRNQQKISGGKLSKYAMVIHNDVKKKAHEFQGELVNSLLEAFTNDAKSGGAQVRRVFDTAYEDLHRSVAADGGQMPEKDECFRSVCEVLQSDEIVVSEVNSDNDVLALLNADAELHLRTPFNVFIGGNILDRGITVPNLISFYYGRNPKRMQADTVLQHSRMYGARDRRDLAVTRFYTSREVYDRLGIIENFEVALRHAFESGAHERGVAFIQTDETKKVIPCAPGKVLLSDIVSVDSGGRLLPVGFKIRAMSHIRSSIQLIDQLIPAQCTDTNKPVLLETDMAHQICSEVAKTMDVEETSWSWQALSALIDYYSKITATGDHRNKIWIAAYTKRSMTRQRPGGRFSNAPDTKQQRDLASQVANDIPMLLLFRQEGLKEQGWTGHPFWWPVFIAPSASVPCIYANETS
jgi:hypothetical protein